MPDDAFEAEEDFMANLSDDLHQQLLRRFAQGATAQCERLALKMIADGQFPSAGWRIAERFTTEGLVMRYECWPLPPTSSPS